MKSLVTVALEEHSLALLLFFLVPDLRLKALFFLFLLLDNVLLLQFVTVFNELVVHLMVHEAVQDTRPHDVLASGDLVFETADHLNLDLDGLRGLEPLGPHALVADALEEPHVLKLVLDEGLDLAHLS